MGLKDVVLRYVAVLLLGGLVLPAMVLAEEPVVKEGGRVLFLPFEAAAAGDYGYLSDPVKNMLAARLAVRAGVEPVESPEAAGLFDGQGRIIPLRLDALLGRYQADYLVVGSLTQTGERLDFQAMVLALSSAAAPQEFTAQAAGGAGVMAAIDQLAADMSARVFAPGRSVPLSSQEESKPVAVPVFQTPHPDRAMKQGVIAVQSSLEGVEGVVPGSLAMRSSNLLPVDIQAMDVGDLDGDGLEEIVVASHGRVLIFQERAGIFRQLSELSLPDGLRVHSLSMADIDGDTRAEIYVSATSDEAPASLILVWQDSRLGVQASRLAWYLRPMVISGEGPVLLGQEAGSDTLLVSGIYRLQLSGSQLHRGTQLSLPPGINLFDFILADVSGDGAAEIVAVDTNERLLVYSPAGQLLWTGGMDYSGSPRFLGLPPVTYQSRGDDIRADRDLIYVPVRLAAADFDGDGRMEILAARNQRLASKYMKRFRYYEGGHVVSLGWREGQMVELWRTNATGSQVVDLQQSKAPAAGQRIYVAQNVEKSLLASFVAGGGQSRLILFDLGRVAEPVKVPAK